MTNTTKIILRSGLIGLLGYLFIGLFLPTASGQTMSNKDYILKTEDLNAVSGSISKGDYQPRSISDELSPELPFSVSLSSDFLDFGQLSPTNPIIRTVDLNIYSLSTLGYSVIASENHTLASDPEASGQNIPNTTCDNGECNQENAGVWINTLSFGFGYSCDNLIGFDCDRSFSNSNFYKSFSDTSNLQSPQFVMAGIGSENKEVRLSYKVNISGNQAQGTYTNIVTFIAVPNF